MKYNKLTLINEVEPKIRNNGSKRRLAIFKCECGFEKVYDYFAVKSGHTKMCNNCAKIIRRDKKVKHNLIKHPLYRKWQDMKKRCYNKNVDRFDSYGGRGISVCSEWLYDFKCFYDFCINNGWTEGLTIDRINVNGNYEPSNCRFITSHDQSYNKLNTFYVLYKGQKLSLSKVLFDNGLSSKYQHIWRMVTLGKKTFDYYVDYYGIKI